MGLDGDKNVQNNWRLTTSALTARTEQPGPLGGEGDEPRDVRELRDMRAARLTPVDPKSRPILNPRHFVHENGFPVGKGVNSTKYRAIPG